jgi:hypothetical protein
MSKVNKKFDNATRKLARIKIKCAKVVWKVTKAECACDLKRANKERKVVIKEANEEFKQTKMEIMVYRKNAKNEHIDTMVSLREELEEQ